MAGLSCHAHAFTVNTTLSTFSCPSAAIQINSDNYCTGSDGSYTKRPVYLGPVIKCAISATTTLSYTFADASLALGAENVLNPNSWILFYAMDKGITMTIDGVRVETASSISTNTLYTLPLAFPPTTATFTNPGPLSATIILPSIFVAAPSENIKDQTSAIVGTTILAMTFLCILAGARFSRER